MIYYIVQNDTLTNKMARHPGWYDVSWKKRAFMQYVGNGGPDQTIDCSLVTLHKHADWP